MELDLARANRRFGGRRWNVMWPATLEIEGRALPCTILDLSRTGARVEGLGLRDTKAVAKLQCEQFGTLEVSVKWARGTKAGLRFARPSAEIMEILQKVVPGIGRREAPPVVPAHRAQFGRRRTPQAA